jgi:cysteine desulfurase
MAISDALTRDASRNEVVMSAVEHASVWAWRERLAARGVNVRVVPVDRDGKINISELEKSISDRTALVSVMLANNETGILYPVKIITELAHRFGALMHTDAVQAVGKVPVDLNGLGVDYATICGHKYHACKGIGALYTKKHRDFSTLAPGGEQEYGRRPGTEPVALIAGLGEASKLAKNWLVSGGVEKMLAMRDSFESWLRDSISDSRVIGRDEFRLPNTTQALIPGVETEPLLAMLDMEGIACSSGSACSSGAHEPSHVLRAMGISDRDGAVVRVSASRFTTESDYQRLREALTGVVKKLRN